MIRRAWFAIAVSIVLSAVLAPYATAEKWEAYVGVEIHTIWFELPAEAIDRLVATCEKGVAAGGGFFVDEGNRINVTAFGLDGKNGFFIHIENPEEIMLEVSVSVNCFYQEKAEASKNS